MAIQGGYNKKLLRVNLSSGKARIEDIEDNVLEMYLGGKSLGVAYMYREIPPGTDPLSPSNKIMIVAGGLSGLAPGSSKAVAVSKSPLTRLLTDSSFGDYFSPLLRKAGFDAVIIEGSSRDPVYLYIRNGEVEIRSAEKLWGKDTYTTTRIVREETTSKASVISIGPAGEKLVKYANIIADSQRAAGRGGLGAVLGSKKLKAVAVYGDMDIPVASPDEFKKLWNELYDKYATSRKTADSRMHGTMNGLIYSSQTGMSPSYNFRKPYIPLELAEKLSHKGIEPYETDPPWWIHGKSCPVKCARYTRLSVQGEEFEVKPEYENVAMLGAATGVFEPEVVLYLNYIANRYGLDSISLGNTIAWFLELVEEGLVDPSDFGLNVKGFGDAGGVIQLARLVGEKKGIGAILAEGVKRASELLGVGYDRAVHVKGLEAPAWDPRGLRGFALSYATADVGASHLRGWPKTRDRPIDGPAVEVVESLARDRDRKTVFDSLGLCIFVPFTEEEIVKLYNYATGLDVDIEELYMASRREESLARIHNVLDWVTPPLDDTIPPRWWEPEEEGPAKGSKAFIDEEDFRSARRKYYEIRGWHPEYGVPLPETLEELGISWAEKEAVMAIMGVELRISWMKG
ncbi:MAG: aldehyde ferredoxin oxidoreductase family protein [Desulfurococcales archaeon]|nr:aldehyde ferredoxin oxidoreductase family protein [Desulfurococcales archaeon]